MADDAAPSAKTLRDLVALVERLRAPDGCPWDREQRLADVRAYLIEEAHETAAAIDEESWQAIAGIHAKMVARHPHVFGDERAADADEVRRAWERRKAASSAGESLLAG